MYLKILLNKESGLIKKWINIPYTRFYGIIYIKRITDKMIMVLADGNKLRTGVRFYADKNQPH
jgi:hypothetical protein